MFRGSELSVTMLLLSATACAGKLENPERFEKGFNAAQTSEDGGGATLGEVPGNDADGGGGGGGGGGAAACTDAAALLKQKCGACHGASAPTAGLDLASDAPGTRLLDQPASSSCDGHFAIDGTTPAQSLIYLKLGDAPPCGGSMPPGAPLSEAEKQCVADWLNTL